MRLAAGLREAVLEAAFIGELSFREETDTPVSKIAPEFIFERSKRMDCCSFFGSI